MKNLDLSKYGITYEPTVQDSIRAGADVVSFSGDKLLGGPQAGIIVGKKEYIDKMKKNPLTRALRIDKFTAATLEVVLQEYLSEERAIKNLPVLQMITKSFEEVDKEAKKLKRFLASLELDVELGLENCESQIGGGSLPLERIPSKAVTIKPRNISTAELEERMRFLPVPIIPRTLNDKILLDLAMVYDLNYDISYNVVGRKGADAPILISNIEKAKKLFNWTPEYSNLRNIIKDTVYWGVNRNY